MDLQPLFRWCSQRSGRRRERIAGMMQYCSSAGVYREFCGTCGASAFYWNEGGKKMDVGAGLLGEKDGGARAKRCCFWYNRLMYLSGGHD
ncbi:hypothetical protein B0H34DRAFT_513935 [Crassisporium funariophilum]|nr:hypothetical protein B0H34DRAFT_513935 [Crassisporium funariophilum]